MAGLKQNDGLASPRRFRKKPAVKLDRIVGELKSQIIGQPLPAGARLPTRIEFMDRFRCSLR
jgi:DNA-binding GntR family transcriptional regulator